MKYVLKTNLQQHLSYEYHKRLSVSFTHISHSQQQSSNKTDTTLQ